MKGGDFNGDGKAGILFQDDFGHFAIWENFQSPGGVGQFQLQGNLPTLGGAWRAKAVLDFDGDGKSDIALQNVNDGTALIFLMDGTQIKANGLFSIAGSQNNGPTWHIVDGRDMDGDGKGDLLWQSDSGASALWEDFTPGAGGVATFATQLNFIPQPNTSGQLDWHIL